MSKKRILIDAAPVVPYFVSGRVNGIGRTTMELIQALDRQPELPFEVMLYSQNMKGIGGRNLRTHFPCRHVYLPNRTRWNKALAHFPVREALTRYDLMHITHNFEYVHRPDRCIVTIHDAMFFSYPEEFLGHDFARKNYPALARKAKAIITCSKNSKQEIAQYMDVPEEKIHVTYWGVNHDVFSPHKAIPCAFTNGKPYFLSVSCDIGRKNTVSVLEAFELFLRQSPKHELILVWRNVPENIRMRFMKPKFQDRVHFINGISNEDLACLYAGASATFFPSRYEGFGLPVLESMACGTPVVTCANSSLGEVGGDAAIYVEPDDINGMATWMEHFEQQDINRSALSEKCFKQAANFTWKRCAEETSKIYEQCLDD